jgi:uncharacterized membrane protein YhdT
MTDNSIYLGIFSILVLLSMFGGKKSGHSTHKPHGTRLLTYEDLNRINQYRVNRDMEEHTASQTSAFLAVLSFIAGGLCVFLLPENFIGYKNFNGWCGIICFGFAVLFILISKISGVHFDSSDRFTKNKDDH